MAFSERPEPAHLSARSERVKKVATLSGRSARSKEGLFRIEGPQAVRSLLTFSPQYAHAVYLTAEAIRAHPELASLAFAANVPAWEVETTVIRAMVREQGNASVANPQGVIAVARHIDRPWRELVDALPSHGPVTIAVCERLQDPGNAGLVLRTADAAGALAVFFGEDSADVLSPKVVRASAGSLLSVPFARKAPIADLLSALKERGIAVAATSPYGNTDLYRSTPDARTAWVFGNEAQGLEDETIKACDVVVRIPLFGRAESLNLATAATLCLFESARAYGKRE